MILEILEALSIVWIAKIVALVLFAYMFVKYFRYFMIAGAVMLIGFLLISIFSVALPLL